MEIILLRLAKRSKHAPKVIKDRPLRRAGVSLLLGLFLALAIVPLSVSMEVNRLMSPIHGGRVWAPSLFTWKNGHFYDDQRRLYRWRVKRDIGVRTLDVLREPDLVTVAHLFHAQPTQGRASKPLEAWLGTRGLWVDGTPIDQRLYTKGYGWPFPVATSTAIDDGQPPPLQPQPIARPRTFDGLVAWTLTRGFRERANGTRLLEPRVYWIGLLLNTLSFAVLSHLIASLIRHGAHAWTTRKIGSRKRRGLCVGCGYNLAQTPAHAPCPECGRTPRARARARTLASGPDSSDG